MSLVLTLKLEGHINIDGPATITLVKIKGQEVRISFDAPKTTTIQRGNIDKLKDTREIPSFKRVRPIK